MVYGGNINLSEPSRNRIVLSQPTGRVVFRGASRTVLVAKESVLSIVSFLALFGIFLAIFNIDYPLLARRIQAFRDPDGFVRTQRIPAPWLDRYNIAITSEEDYDADTDGDGLTLHQEYIHLTDPINPDTDGDGVPDGAEVEEGTNPRGVGVADVDGDGMPDTWERAHNLNPLQNDRDGDLDRDGLSNYQEYLHKLDPSNPDTDNDTFPDGTEVRNGYDPSAPGDAKPEVTVVIDKIDVTVPMVWSQTVLEEQLQEDLKRGAIHYPKTAAPGQSGNMFIAAHSSNYAWVEGNFNYVFSKLNNVVPGDIITITVRQKNGAVITYTYKVKQQRIVMPDDPWLFATEGDAAVATLSTCWPIGTRQKRLAVKAELIGVEARKK